MKKVIGCNNQRLDITELCNRRSDDQVADMLRGSVDGALELVPQIQPCMGKC